MIQEKEVIVLGGDNIGHCEKENRTNMCLVLNGYRDPAVPIRKHKSSLNVTYLLTPWTRVLHEKLASLQLVKKFPAFCGTRRFLTALTSARHLSLS